MMIATTYDKYGEPQKNILITINAKDVVALDKIARDKGISRNQVIKRAIRIYIAGEADND